MKRSESGRYVVTNAGGEEVRAFVPSPLPPEPDLRIDGRLQTELERANLSLGRLDGVSSQLPDTGLFLYAYVRKEAVLSSQIEGTQSSLSDLLLFELDGAAGVPFDDVVEVSNYVAALEHGLSRMADDFPLSNRLIREMHEILLSRGRGAGKDPGRFRRSQNWIGGTRPGNAAFVPPPHTYVEDCMAALETFLHAGDDMPVLVRAALAHAQFETIHPFLDGNGRVGRLLITLLLHQADVLREPLLYLSLFLKTHRQVYYDHLSAIRQTGEWEGWLSFFLAGVHETADGAVLAAEAISALFEEDRQRIREVGRRAGSALRVHKALLSRPLLAVRQASAISGLSYPGAAAGLGTLEHLGIASEITGRRRDRVWSYDAYIRRLSEGTEPL